MAHRFACIGFPVETEADLRAIIATARGEGERDGQKTLWHDPSGAMLALFTDADGELECMTPSFAGSQLVRMNDPSFVDDDECAYCVALSFEVIDEDGEMAYPFFMQLADAQVERRPGAVARPTLFM